MKISSLLQTFQNFKLQELSLAYQYCHVCSIKRVMVRLYHSEIAVRCVFCRATAVTMALAGVLQQLVPDLSAKEVYELSSRGPLVALLTKKCKKLTCSEYFENVPPGKYHNNILCQDVQQLTFADSSFDICTATEVFEHVPDDMAGFAEIRRVLRPGGLFLFTVPLFPHAKTVERAKLDTNQDIVPLLPRQYHGDPNRGHQPILVFRDYGDDIQQRLLKQGFATAQIISPVSPLPWGYTRRVIAAYR